VPAPAPSRPGVVYTPREVARAMVAHALAPLVRGRGVAELGALRILDVATGDGIFAASVVELLVERGVPRERAERCIVGVDVDEVAIAAARAALPGADLRVANALTHDFGAGLFDLVIGNPPYIRQELLAGDAKQALRGYAVFDGVADLYVYFIELAQRIASRWCLIVPNKWLTAQYARPLRAFLAREACVEGIVDFGSIPLFEAADAFPCIVWGARRATSPAIVVARATSAQVARELERGAPQDRASFTAEPWAIDRDEDRALLQRLAREHAALGSIVERRPSRGVVTGCNAAFVIDRATRDALGDSPLIRPLVRGRDLRPFTVAPQRFVLLVDHGTPIDDHPRIRDHLARHRARLEARKPGTYAWYELQDPVGPIVKARGARLLYQDIQTSPACALDREGELVPDTTVWMLPTDDLAILAILNSSLYHWYARRRFAPALNGAVRPKWEYLARFPIARPSPDLRAALEALVGDPAIDRARLDALVAESYGLSSVERSLIAT